MRRILLMLILMGLMAGCVGSGFRDAWDQMTPEEQVDQGVMITQDVVEVALPPELSHAAVIALGAFGTWYGNRKGRVRGQAEGEHVGVGKMVRVVEKSANRTDEGDLLITMADLQAANAAIGTLETVEKHRHPMMPMK